MARVLTTEVTESAEGQEEGTVHDAGCKVHDGESQ